MKLYQHYLVNKAQNYEASNLFVFEMNHLENDIAEPKNHESRIG